MITLVFVCHYTHLLTMKILGISLSEFHDKAGFQLVKSVPQVTVLTKEQFNLCSDLILPREEMCDRLLALQFKEDYFLVMKPLLSKNKDWDKSYKRQKYIYSISILVAKADYLDKVKQPLYKETVSKIAHFFKYIEETDHIIYFHEKFTDYIEAKLTHIFSDINLKGSCELTFQCNYFSFLNVHYPPSVQKKSKISQSSVPVTLLTEKEINMVESDLAKQLLVYAYSGVFTFKKICRLHPEKKQADIGSFYNKAIEKGVVFMLDMISLNNVYVLTEKISKYVSDSDDPQQQLAEIAKIVDISEEGDLHPNELLCFYLQFNRVGSLAKIIEVNKRLVARIDVVKCIRMAQIHGFLVRIHQKIAYNQLPYPLIMVDSLRRLITEREKIKLAITERILEEEMEKMSDMVKMMLSANASVDEMMVNLDVDNDKLMSLLNSQNRFVYQINDE